MSEERTDGKNMREERREKIEEKVLEGRKQMVHNRGSHE